MMDGPNVLLGSGTTVKLIWASSDKKERTNRVKVQEKWCRIKRALGSRRAVVTDRCRAVF